MLTRELLWTREAKLAVATGVALLAALTLLLSLFARPGEAQVSLLPPDQIGAQASADVTFADLAPPQSGSNVFHVDPDGADNVIGNTDDGSDSNLGTRERPWKTIGKAARMLDDGQVAYVHGGTYNERVTTGHNGTPTAPIWLLEAPGESAVIKGDGTSGDPFIRITKSYWVMGGFEINGGGSQNHAIRFQKDPANLASYDAHHVVVKDVDVHSGRGPAAVAFQGATDAALLNSKVHDYKFDNNDSHGVLVTGASARLLIEGNNSWGNDGDDVQCQQASGVTAPRDLTIERNRYGNTHPGGTLRSRTRENAVDIKTCDNVTVSGNKLFGFRPSSVPCPGNCSPHGDAIVIHENASRVLIEGNRIWNSGRGASIGGSNGTLGPIVFRRNLVFDMATGTGLSTDTVGSGNGIRISHTPDAEIYHNTFYNLRGKAIAIGDEGSVSRADVINNIVQRAGTGFSRGSVSSLTVQKNLFWETSQGVPAGSIVADPMFVDDPRNNDFYTKPASPARDVALREPLLVDPKNPDYCDDGPDIGFLETCHSAPPIETAAGDLATHINSFVGTIPRQGSEAYDVPTSSERSTMAAAYDAIEAGDLSRAASLVDPLNYDVVQYEDTVTGRNLILLSERRNADGSWPHAWGMYVFSPAAASDTAVEVTHPVFEVNIEDVGVEVFRKANAEDLFIAGAHRYANTDGSADVAHADASVFEDVHKAAVESATKVFQPHGFSQASHPDCGEVVVSAGTAPPTELAQKVHGSLRNAGFNTVLYDGVSCRELGATTNVQGISTRQIGADFLHVEISKPIRDAAARRSLLSGTITGALGSSGNPQPDTFTYAPTHDARVEEANPSTNYGGSSILRTDGGAGSRVESYLQYAVTNIPAGERVQSAKLRLWDTDNGTADGPAVYTSASGWSESAITWANRPTKSGSGVADKGAVASASWVEFDVAPLVTSNATYSFVLSQPGTDGANYASKEHSDATKKPQLVVTTGTTTSATLVGAGDIATGGSATEATAKLVRAISGTVFTAGDNAYDSGTDAEFQSKYDPTWGTEKARTRPSVGNHEYNTPGASGYFDYFGAAAGARDKGYYSYDLGEWHIVSLNSMCENVGGCGATSPMVTWLKEDLAANASHECTLAYFHHPLFSSGYHGNQTKMKPTWDALYAANADVVVNGHDHNYERFAPQNPNGTADAARGIREFVVGTGGAGLRSFGTIKPNSQVRNSDTHGVLKLTLNPASYDWQFVPVAGKTFTDSGSTSCH